METSAVCVFLYKVKRMQSSIYQEQWKKLPLYFTNFNTAVSVVSSFSQFFSTIKFLAWHVWCFEVVRCTIFLTTTVLYMRQLTMQWAKSTVLNTLELQTSVYICMLNYLMHGFYFLSKVYWIDGMQKEFVQICKLQNTVKYVSNSSWYFL